MQIVSADVLISLIALNHVLQCEEQLHVPSSTEIVYRALCGASSTVNRIWRIYGAHCGYIDPCRKKERGKFMAILIHGLF